jgi:hypothetical protein
MARPLWQLLSEEASVLTCEECFVVMEYYAEILASGDIRLLPMIMERLKRCPRCEVQFREALYILSKGQRSRD